MVGGGGGQHGPSPGTYQDLTLMARKIKGGGGGSGMRGQRKRGGGERGAGSTGMVGGKRRNSKRKRDMRLMTITVLLMIRRSAA